jgi:L-asparaginase
VYINYFLPSILNQRLDCQETVPILTQPEGRALHLIKRFTKAQREKASNRVMVWTMTLDPILPEAMLESLDGLVLAGMGSGSIARSVVEQLAPKWTSKIPIVITSRCPVGLNYDDYYYRGSLEKYESKGFQILGYEQLNPLQARLKLILEMASES